jgi:hypothetical protein
VKCVGSLAGFGVRDEQADLTHEVGSWRKEGKNLLSRWWLLKEPVLKMVALKRTF